MVGATGCVGQMILKIMAERLYIPKELFLLASKDGRDITYLGQTYPVKNLKDFDFSNADIAFFAAGAAVSKEFVEKATKAGCFVIDKTSHFRMQDDIPLVIPEINASEILNAKKLIVSNPNCSTTPLAIALYKLNQINPIDHIVVSTYQAVSGLGQKGLLSLEEEMNNIDFSSKTFFKKIAYNVVPQIDMFLEDNSTKEEWKMKVELNKILKSNIQCNITCVRVPVRFGHSMSVFVQFKNKMKKEDILNAWHLQKGLCVLDDPKSLSYATPLENSNDDLVYASRLRQESDNRFLFWLVTDNLRKGAALNAVQILDHLLELKKAA